MELQYFLMTRFAFFFKIFFKLHNYNIILFVVILIALMLIYLLPNQISAVELNFNIYRVQRIGLKATKKMLLKKIVINLKFNTRRGIITFF